MNIVDRWVWFVASMLSAIFYGRGLSAVGGRVSIRFGDSSESPIKIPEPTLARGESYNGLMFVGRKGVFLPKNKKWIQLHLKGVEIQPRRTSSPIGLLFTGRIEFNTEGGGDVSVWGQVFRSYDSVTVSLSQVIWDAYSISEREILVEALNKEGIKLLLRRSFMGFSYHRSPQAN